MDQQCPECGTELPANVLECPECGQRLDDVTVLGEPSIEPAPSPTRRRRIAGWLYLLPPGALVIAGIVLMLVGDERLAQTGGYVLIGGVLLWGVVRIWGPR